ncbi:MAG: NAD(P)H-binding protein, partial [Rothia dentocariosa]
MNIAVIGATGMVGERIVAEAVARGHQVDAYSRSGNVVPGAESKTVDLANTDELVSIVNGHDVTIIAVSAGRGTSADPVINAHKALI